MKKISQKTSKMKFFIKMRGKNVNQVAIASLISIELISLMISMPMHAYFNRFQAAATFANVHVLWLHATQHSILTFTKVHR
jgi:hypothetical protein